MYIFFSFLIDCDANVRSYHIFHNTVYVVNAIIWEKYSFLLTDILMMNHFYCSFIAFHQLLLMFITFSILSYKLSELHCILNTGLPLPSQAKSKIWCVILLIFYCKWFALILMSEMVLYFLVVFLSGIGNKTYYAHLQKNLGCFLSFSVLWGHKNRQIQNLYLVFNKEGRWLLFKKKLDSWLGWKWKVGWLDGQMNGWKSNFPLWLFSIPVFLFDSTLIIYNCQN